MQDTPAASDQIAHPELSTEKMLVSYANLCRGMMTAEEIVLDFGFNPNSGGKVVDEPVEVRTRVVLSLPSAVRLHQLLHALLAKRQEAVEQAMARQKEQAAATATVSPPSPSE